MAKSHTCQLAFPHPMVRVLTVCFLVIAILLRARPRQASVAFEIRIKPKNSESVRKFGTTVAGRLTFIINWYR